MGNTPDVVIALWKHRVAVGGQFPEKALECLEQVVQDPPSDLVELLQQHGWVFLEEEDSGKERLCTFDEHVQWLRKQVVMLRRIFTGHE